MYIQGLKQIDGRKSVVRDDVTKSFPFHKAAVSINPLNSLEHRKVKYAIKIKNISSAYIVSDLLCHTVHICSSKFSWLDFHELHIWKKKENL